MKHLKRILSIILVLATFAGSFVGSWHLFNQGTYEFDSENLAVFDENLSCYYLQKVDKDIIFRVRCENDTALSYSLVDDANGSVQTKSQKASKNCYDILPPSNGYEAGVRYTLSLPDGVVFDSEDLKDARSLVFSIDKEAIEKYEFTDAVVKVDAVLEDVIDNTLDVDSHNVAAGDIIFGQNENDEYVVYIGEEVYTLWLQGDSSNEELSEKLEAVKIKKTEIEQLVIELNSIDDRDNEILGTKIEEAKEESVIPSKPCCPNCGSECDVSAKFCRKCGYKLQ